MIEGEKLFFPKWYLKIIVFIINIINRNKKLIHNAFYFNGATLLNKKRIEHLQYL